MNKKINVEQIIADSILSNPMRFEVGGQQFSFYPPTLGQVLMTKEVLSKAGFSWERFSANPIGEAMTFVGSSKKDALKVIAINLLVGKENVCNSRAVEKVEKEIAGLSNGKELPTLLIAMLTRDNNMIDSVIKNTGLQRDRTNMQKVMSVKQGKNNFVFGRRTLFGQLIDSACSRYGWTFEYVIWGISYQNLQLLVADQEVSVFLSDKELKEVHITNDREVINADDPSNMERIKAMFND